MHHFPAPGDIDPELDQLVPVPTVGRLGYYQNRLQHSLAALDPTDQTPYGVLSRTCSK